MAKSENRKYYTAIVVAALIACAILARVLGKNDILLETTGLLRTMIYIGLYIGWGKFLFTGVSFMHLYDAIWSVSHFWLFFGYAANAENIISSLLPM